MSLLRATRSQALLILAGILLVAIPLGPDAAARQANDNAEGIVRAADGMYHLAANTGPAPAMMGEYARFGMLDSSPARLPLFQSVKVQYRPLVPAGTEAFVAVRASADGQQWGEWEWNIANGATVTFDGEQQWAQYRVVLLGAMDRSPRVSAVTLTPVARYSAQGMYKRAAKGVAPTYRLRVTRQGMVGGRTANGHIIKRGDMFVSLPSWTSLSSKGGKEYMVRLSANGKSVVVPVMDVGPWNRHDNFWDTDRARYKDLPVGWPEDHAAYYENYNRRRAETGWVRFPSAVDVADGAYWALGLDGGQAVMDVTFLWLGADPGPNPPPLNSAPSRRP